MAKHFSEAWLLASVLALLPALSHGQQPAAKPAPPGAHSHHEVVTEKPGAAQPWTSTPLILPLGRGMERGGVSLETRNLNATQFKIHPSDTPDKPWDQALEQGVAKVKPANPMDGGAHWISARQESEGEVRVASTLWFFANKGSSPQAMLNLPKETLEILPLPASNRYREGESWEFMVRFQGQPLPAVPVTFETAQGSSKTLSTDTRGLIKLAFPHDIDLSRYPGVDELARIRVPFVLSTRHRWEGKEYLTAFNTAYTPDRMRERSLGWGAGFASLGMLMALPLLRRKEKKNG